MDQKVIWEANRQANIELCNRIVKKNLIKNIKSLEHMIESMKRTSGPITVSYKDLTAKVIFANDPEGTRKSFITMLQNLLEENQQVLKEMTGQTSVPEKEESYVPSRPYTSYDQDGNREDDDE